MVDSDPRMLAARIKKYRYLIGLYSDSRDLCEVSSSGDEGFANKFCPEQRRENDTCKAFHEYGALTCGHLIPFG